VHLTLALAVVTFVIGVDNYIVAAILPDIAADLDEPVAAVGLLASAYALPTALLAPVFGPLSDRRGRRFSMLLGLTLFTIAAAACVVAPSLPGYVFSFRPGQQRFSVERIADTFARLMTEVLGYPRFAAQGGDWGGFVTSRLGLMHRSLLYGIHVNLLAVRRDPKMLQNPSAEEKSFLEQLNHWLKEETGYQWIQGTRPQTLAYALTDSPAGLAAWIAEKFWSWVDCDGDLFTVLTRDELLDNVMLYWLPATGASSARLYWESMRTANTDPVPVPVGCSQFPHEVYRSSRRWAETRYPDLRWWHELDKGGHFAALEQPEIFVDEVRSFFRLVR